MIQKITKYCFHIFGTIFSTFRRKCLIEIPNMSLLSSFGSRSVSPFARFIPRQRIRYISATVLVFDARRRWLLASREISLPFAPLPRNGTSLSRWSQSRVLGQKRVFVLVPGPIPSAKVVKDFPFYSFRRLALSFVRNQRATSPIRRRFLKQPSCSSSSHRRRSPRRYATVSSSSSSFCPYPPLSLGYFYLRAREMLFLKYCWISRGKDGNAIRNKLDCLSSIVRSPRLTSGLKCSTPDFRKPFPFGNFHSITRM